MRMKNLQNTIAWKWSGLNLWRKSKMQVGYTEKKNSRWEFLGYRKSVAHLKTLLNVSLESTDTRKILLTHWWGVFGVYHECHTPPKHTYMVKNIATYSNRTKTHINWHVSAGATLCILLRFAVAPPMLNSATPILIYEREARSRQWANARHGSASGHGHWAVPARWAVGVGRL